MVAEQCSLVAKLLSIIAINMENVLIRGLGCKAYIDVESRLSDLMRTILSLFFSRQTEPDFTSNLESCLRVIPNATVNTPQLYPT